MITVQLNCRTSIPEPWGRFLRTIIIVVVLVVVGVNREALASVLGL